MAGAAVHPADGCGDWSGGGAGKCRVGPQDNGSDAGAARHMSGGRGLPRVVGVDAGCLVAVAFSAHASDNPLPAPQ